MMIKKFFTFSLALSLSACGSDSAKQSQLPSDVAPGTTQNIILMVGDGMGLTQISAAIEEHSRKLEMERFQVVGLSKTRSAKEQITDSAAGATAFSTGVKTYNGAIGVDQHGRARETILELLGNKGYATGLIATSVITHATPASFYAHEDSRQNYYQIAADMKKAPLDLFIGGGRKHFENRTDPNNGKTDDRNLIEEMQTSGFSFVNSLAELRKAKGKVGYFLADGHPDPILKGRGDILPRSIPTAISHLRSRTERGFFLMVEGSQIDWGGHENKIDYVISELIDFDEAVGKALDYAEANGNTLVIVTADHETGGLTLAGEPGEDGKTSYTKAGRQFASHGHTSAMVPVFAYGPGSELFAGVYDNNEIHAKMMQALALDK
ncbi:alkaline phosphatase [Arenicella chitinivorans]|uniref:Alkaline phosphatase n=1 Tax=Arenicella chitinivorans TaxID=1329800 RepID=A0A918VJQ4_9GAMM|nr:alkaline phosphatase [Arenicella chitinivorans]GHA01398.1 alkaline phosphatase [Arenicella chitinivorans]